MKALYIIAWIGLVLSIVVHTLLILGSEDVLTSLDAFVWILHGGCVLLGLPLVLCSGKITIGNQEKSFWADVLKDCPPWMKKIVGFFFLYGIINFILFIISGVEENDGSTPASVFKGFSGHWMILYSIEVAVFYSYLKKCSDTFKNSLNEQSMSMSGELHQRCFQAKRKQYSRIIILFLIVGSVFCGLLWLAFKGYPWFLGVTLFSLFPFMVIHALYAICCAWRTGVYLKKNHNQIWEKSKSPSFADRIESQRLIKEMNDPYLKSLRLKATRFSTICFWAWLVVIVIVLAGLSTMQ